MLILLLIKRDYRVSINSGASGNGDGEMRALMVNGLDYTVAIKARLDIKQAAAHVTAVSCMYVNGGLNFDVKIAT